MDLKDFIIIFRKNKRWFWGAFLLTFVFGLGVWFSLSGLYKAEVDLNITRTGYQKETSEYRYDEFYRLQADERFADTVVRWIGSKRIQSDIIRESEGVYFSKLKGQRLSSQMIKISFLIKDKEKAGEISRIVSQILNNKTDELNFEQKNPQWFKLLVSAPVVDKYGLPWWQMAILLSALGSFAGFWAVLVRHYWE
ncbi:MAG: hypothetical protein V3574_03985 [Candidatus Moraniibacteriota bacterium]